MICTRANVDRMIPAAFSGCTGTKFTNRMDQPIWVEKVYMYEGARRILAENLQRAARLCATPCAGTIVTKALYRREEVQ